MLLKACLNGNRSPEDHSALPISAQDLARDAQRVVEAGAGALHIHPRGSSGTETLDAEAIGDAVAAVRTACPGIPVGVATGDWIEPNFSRRKELIGLWGSLPEERRPDFASVNFSEEGALEICVELLAAEVGVEAGLWSARDARLLIQSGLAERCTRLLIELVHQRTTEEARLAAQEIEDVLDTASTRISILLHGEGPVAWPMLAYALEKGYDARVGLEDTLTMPDGSPARDNAQLVGVAQRLLSSVEK